MAEQDATTPQAEVAPELSIEERLQRLYSPPKPKVEAEAAPETEAPPEETPQQEASQSDEVTPDDIPDEGSEGTKPLSADEFEIVHNGTQHKLTREEAIRLAQQGFDYTQKTQALAEKARGVDVRLQQAEELAQMVPALSKELAAVQALETQLAQWKNVDWVALASNQDTVFDYPKYRATYDQLREAYNAANHALNESGQRFLQQKQQLAQARLQDELPRLKELIPQWKDETKRATGVRELREYLVKAGVPEERVDSLNSATEVSLAWKAMQYDRLVAAKSEKVKQMRAAPPVVKPGAVGTQQTAAQQKTQQMRQNLKKTGDWRDAAALLARMK